MTFRASCVPGWVWLSSTSNATAAAVIRLADEAMSTAYLLHMALAAPRMPLYSLLRRFGHFALPRWRDGVMMLVHQVPHVGGKLWGLEEVYLHSYNNSENVDIMEIGPWD